MNLRRRVVFVLFLVVGGLIPFQSISSAQSAGSELAEAVAQETSGGDAYVVLDSVEAFSVDGGEAVFEPGTDYEEAFTYATTDTSTGRLVGLTRPAPVAHSAGVFVEARTSQTPEPDATPAPSGPSPAAAESGESEEGSGPSSSETTEGNLDPVCELASGVGCEDTVAEIINDPPSPDDLCADNPNSLLCAILNDPPSPDDLCADNPNTLLCAILNDPPSPDDLCADNPNTLLCAILEEISDPCGSDEGCPPIDDLCQIDGECAPIDTVDQTIVELDRLEYSVISDAIIDEWELADGPLADSHCTATASAPQKASKYTLKAVGTMSCPNTMAEIAVGVQIQMLKGGKWVEISPAVVWGAVDASSVSGPVHAGCRTGERKYRSVAIGQANGYNGGVHKDSDKSGKVTIPCPARDPESALIPPLN